MRKTHIATTCITQKNTSTNQGDLAPPNTILLDKRFLSVNS